MEPGNSLDGIASGNTGSASGTSSSVGTHSVAPFQPLSRHNSLSAQAANLKPGLLPASIVIPSAGAALPQQQMQQQMQQQEPLEHSVFTPQSAVRGAYHSGGGGRGNGSGSNDGYGSGHTTPYYHSLDSSQRSSPGNSGGTSPTHQLQREVQQQNNYSPRHLNYLQSKAITSPKNYTAAGVSGGGGIVIGSGPTPRIYGSVSPAPTAATSVVPDTFSAGVLPHLAGGAVSYRYAENSYSSRQNYHNTQGQHGTGSKGRSPRLQQQQQQPQFYQSSSPIGPSANSVINPDLPYGGMVQKPLPEPPQYQQYQQQGGGARHLGTAEAQMLGVPLIGGMEPAQIFQVS